MLYIAGDKHGYKVIQMVEQYLKLHDIVFENVSVQSGDEEMKLEDMIPKVTSPVQKEKALGILVCGTGIGVEVGANKFSGIRACLATSPQIAQWSRVYDDCNALCLVGWNAEQKQVDALLDAWFNAEYDGDTERRKMFQAFDEWH